MLFLFPKKQAWRQAASSSLQRRDNFTLIETLITVSILGIIIAAISPLAMTIYRNYVISQVQARFESEIMTAQEWIKRDLTGSARGEFILWPVDQEDDIQALSLPVFRRGNQSEDVFDSSGALNWSQTVIYHIHSLGNDKYELRRTVFEPRVDLEPEQRLAQVRDVYQNGNGQGTYNSSNASTQTLLTSLTDYRMNSQPATVDTYAQRYRSGNYYSLGTWKIEPGHNTYRFTISGTNEASTGTGTDIGLDEILVSETGLAKDAECLVPVNTSGGTAGSQSMAHLTGWRNNAELLFTDGSIGDHMTLQIHNDSWIESTFVNDQARTDGTEITYDDDIGENICRLIGRTATWEASTQSLNNFSEDDEKSYDKYNIRVMISGEQISYPGQRSAATFKAAESGNRGLYIREAYIMEQQDGFNGVPGSAEKLDFSGQPYFTGSGEAFLFAGEKVVSDFTHMEIDPEKNYLVSYYVETSFNETDLANDRLSSWEDAQDRTNTFIYQGQDEDGNPISDRIAGDTDWSHVADEVEDVAAILGVEEVRISYPKEGFYTSRIVDTRQSNPSYDSVNWRHDGSANTDIEIAVRAGDQPDLSDAGDWDAAHVYSNSDGINSLSVQGRYVQWRARLISEDPYMQTPSLRDVELRWQGRERTVDVAVNVAKGPDRGIFTLQVNDQEPQPAQLGMFFTLGQKIHDHLHTRSFSTQVNPRN